MRLNPLKQRGAISLIEVLVALLVLTFGILGLAGMQISSLRGNTSALVRTQATELGYDLMDRMRANRDVAINGGYAAGFGSAEEPPELSLASSDIEQWKALLASFLPSGGGSVVVSDRLATVVIRWDENWATNADQNGFVYLTLQGEL